VKKLPFAYKCEVFVVAMLVLQKYCMQYVYKWCSTYAKYF